MNRLPSRHIKAKSLNGYGWLPTAAIVLAALIVCGLLAYREANTSHLQARLLSGLARSLSFELRPGSAPEPIIAQAGPYDRRLGYSRLPLMIAKLSDHGFQVGAQAWISPRMRQLMDLGLFLPYKEKCSAGINIMDPTGQVLYRKLFPGRIYPNFEAIPPVVTASLLFIEDRNLLDARTPEKNPAVNWPRLFRAVLDKAIQWVSPGHDVPGGSTLATQIEKYRHSPDGLTLTPMDKIRQIASASIRAYLDGPETLETRRRVVVDYLNTVPLGAASGFGEVIGIGDGLWAWYGLNDQGVNAALRNRNLGQSQLAEAGRVYKHLLSLMIAQRRPSAYLGSDRNGLEALTESYLRVLIKAGVVPQDLGQAALRARLSFPTAPEVKVHRGFGSEKAAYGLRAHLSALLGVPSLYDLDRLDLTVQSSLYADLQEKIARTLFRLNDPGYARAAGLYGERLLGKGDPRKIIYSVSFSELTAQGLKPRIQADNLLKPFDINQGTKLELGSTAKLRTLVTYLEIIEALHSRYSGFSRQALVQEAAQPHDTLSQWGLQFFITSPDKSLAAMLNAALERKYAAAPNEQFFTGGGVHRFKNFRSEEDHKIFTVREATQNSVNLVYIRLMRDIVHYYQVHIPGSSAVVLKDMGNAQRETYLKRFADREGREFLSRFYSKYKGRSPAQIAELFFSGIRKKPHRLAAAYRSIHTEASLEQFVRFLKAQLPGFENAAMGTLRSLFDAYGPEKYSLADQGYLANVHPLELWLVRFLITHPLALYPDAVAASSKQRIAVYDWLFKTRHKNAQDIRIRSLLEVEAFLEIYRSWKRLGYPFGSLVPSLATAIGSSADRPAALAQLVGVLLNDGESAPTRPIEGLCFAADTPFETIVKPVAPARQRLLSTELAAAVRRVLIDVVARGTASRLANALTAADGKPVPIGGKTGTGDNRYVTFTAAGTVKESRVINRSATFVFFIGNRFFGTITAFVPGPEAAGYQFTSSLPVQLLKVLLPDLKPLIFSPQPLSDLS
jgi:membrane peptidoglycan carboxypeptidase